LAVCDSKARDEPTVFSSTVLRPQEIHKIIGNTGIRGVPPAFAAAQDAACHTIENFPKKHLKLS
jgi:hypothetical protein